MSEPKISAADAVYREVKGCILDGSIAGGALISEGEISELLDVSRTPVREAFVRLQAEGWMTLYPKRGALVRAVEPREVRDVVEARIAVESRAARSVVEAQEHRDVAIDLGEILRRQRQSLETGDHDDSPRPTACSTPTSSRPVATPSSPSSTSVSGNVSAAWPRASCGRTIAAAATSSPPTPVSSTSSPRATRPVSSRS